MNRIACFASLLLLTAAAAAGCDGSKGRDPAALDVPAGVWTWIDVPESACDDGTPTGFAVNPGESGDVYLYFEGGGACWDYVTCFVLNTSVHGPFGQAEWAARLPMLAGPFDRARTTNPFRRDTLVYIPYCTSDLHVGSAVVDYTVADMTRTAHHVGRPDTEAFVRRVAATWPRPARVVVSGTSAGGFGAALNYHLLRQTFSAARVTLIDDAGPLLEGTGVPASERDAWWSSWHLGDVVTPICASCKDDLSAFYPALVALHPTDRMVLLSSLQDAVIRAYFMLTPDQFQASLLMTLHDRFEQTANLRSFLVTGEQHGLLAGAAQLSTAGVNLETWLEQMVDDQPGWTSIAP